MKPDYICLAAILSVLILISGCAPNVQDTQGEAKEKKGLSTAITPARDLTGTWQGRATWHDNVANPACSYEGMFSLALTQNNNQLEGTFQTTITKADNLLQSVPCSQLGAYPESALAGTASSATAQFSVGTIDFSATFTTDLMEGTFESCPDQICSDGSRAVGSTGEFSLTRQG